MKRKGDSYVMNLKTPKKRLAKAFNVGLVATICAQLLVPIGAAEASSRIMAPSSGAKCIAIQESEIRHVIMESASSQQGIDFKTNGHDWDGVPEGALENDVTTAVGNYTSDSGTANLSDEDLGRLDNMNIRVKEADWFTPERLEEVFEEQGANDMKGTAQIWFKYADQYNLNVATMIGIAMQETNLNKNPIPVSRYNVGGVAWANWMSDWNLTRSSEKHNGRYYPVVDDKNKGIELLFYTYDRIGSEVADSPRFKDILMYHDDINGAAMSEDYAANMWETAINILPPVEPVDEAAKRKEAEQSRTVDSFKEDAKKQVDRNSLKGQAQSKVNRDSITNQVKRDLGNDASNEQIKAETDKRYNTQLEKETDKLYNNAVNKKAKELYDTYVEEETQRLIEEQEKINKEKAQNEGRKAMEQQEGEKFSGPGGGPGQRSGTGATQSPVFTSPGSRPKATFNPDADYNNNGIPDGEEVWGYDDVGFVWEVFNRAETNVTRFLTSDDMIDGEGNRLFNIEDSVLDFKINLDADRRTKAGQIFEQTTEVPSDLAEPGDVVFFGTNRDSKVRKGETVDHVGIYAGIDEEEKRWMWHISEVPSNNGVNTNTDEGVEQSTKYKVEKVQIGAGESESEHPEYANPYYGRHKEMNIVTSATLPNAQIDANGDVLESVKITSSSTTFPNDRDVKPNQNFDKITVGYTGPQAGEGQSSQAGAQLVGTGTTNLDMNAQQEEYIKKTYEVLNGEYGFSGEMVAGLIGNAIAEGGGAVDPTAVETVTGEPYTIGPKKKAAEANGFQPPAAYRAQFPGVSILGIGIYQWSNERNTMLLNFAKERGGNWYDFDVQMAFMVAGDNPSDIEVVKNIALSETGDPAQNALQFHDLWERSADSPEMASRRAKYAVSVWEDMRKKGMDGAKDTNKINKINSGASSGEIENANTSATQSNSGEIAVGCGDGEITGGTGSGEFKPGESVPANGKAPSTLGMFGSYAEVESAQVNGKSLAEYIKVPQLDVQAQVATSPFTGGIMGQCTELTWMYMNQLYGSGAGVSGAGNGKDVYKAYQAQGADVTDNPTVGYGFSYSGILGADTFYGHTGIVVGVLEDGSFITANFNYGPHKAPSRKIVYQHVSGTNGAFKFFGPPASHAK